MNIPTGIVTFLFTDIEGSTKLAQEFPDSHQISLEKHHLIIQEAIKSNNGFVFKIVGDAFCSAFDNADDAVKAAYETQINLNSEKCNGAPIKVRIGIHSGNAEWSGSQYMGYITFARTERVMSASYGGQILISSDAFELVKEKSDITDLPVRSQAGEIRNGNGSREYHSVV